MEKKFRLVKKAENETTQHELNYVRLGKARKV